MTKQELMKYAELGGKPAVVYCDKRYEGICCMIKVTWNNTVFLDYDDTYDDADSQSAFRATFRYSSYDKMIKAIEEFTGKSLSELVINPRCYEKFECSVPDWTAFQWDLYNGKTGFPEYYDEFFIGGAWWNALYTKRLRPDSGRDELREFLRERTV